jgi:hypothetical protein
MPGAPRSLRHRRRDRLRDAGRYLEEYMRLSLVLAPLLQALATSAGAQAMHPASEALPIRDNSFLVEEAYIQERGVVQHISTFDRSASGGGWEYTFTQEWPLGGQRHQIGFTLPVEGVPSASGSGTGIGDIALNYRYQVAGIAGEGARGAAAFAPRVTLILPSGSNRRGLGRGGAALQINFPLSVELPASLVTHSNAGATFTPRARDSHGDRAATLDYTLAQSLIWHALPRFDLMLEAAWSREQHVTGPGRNARSSEVLLAPGVRTAFDFASGLQVVPGLAFPIGVGPSRGESSVFFYLSFEHPFAREVP